VFNVTLTANENSLKFLDSPIGRCGDIELPSLNIKGRNQTMEADLGVAIIGSGGISTTHAMAYQNFSGASLLAFCDIDAEKAKNRATEFGCQRVSST